MTQKERLEAMSPEEIRKIPMSKMSYEYEVVSEEEAKATENCCDLQECVAIKDLNLTDKQREAWNDVSKSHQN